MLVLTASIGEGHDLPARTLAAQIREEAPSADVIIEDGLRAMGPGFVLVNERGAAVVFHRFQWIWDVAFLATTAFPPTRGLTKLVASLVGSRGLMKLVDRTQPDVIVSVYPVATEVLAFLRRRSRLSVPVVAAVTDLAALHYWVAPGVDVSMVVHPASAEEVRDIAGSSAEVVAVHGLSRPEFTERLAPEEARRTLGLREDGKVVVVSGGGWGVGDLPAGIDEALAVEDVELVVALCGRNDALLASLSARYRGDVRVRVEGFTEHMRDWLAAADVLVHSTGGLTILEADAAGCPTISFGWGRGHIRVHDRAFERYGIATVARSRSELASALRKALAAPRGDGLDLAAFPSAASVVLAQRHA